MIRPSDIYKPPLTKESIVSTIKRKHMHILGFREPEPYDYYVTIWGEIIQFMEWQRLSNSRPPLRLIVDYD